jgi:hypothetical protein
VRRALFLLGLIAVAACRREAPRPAAPNPDAVLLDDSAERASLTNIARGATIISRTGESYLGTAADAAIDGNPSTFWANPANDFPHSIVIGLSARARIERVGLRTPQRGFTANHVKFEGSLDGAAWQPVATVTAAEKATPQWFNVPPAEAKFLRATMVDGRSGIVRLQSVLAAGKELEPAHVGSIEGCWMFNGSPAYFEQRGARILGVVALGKEPVYLDGGVAGRVFRFVWVRGNDYGLALMSVSADSQHLTAEAWHEEAIAYFRADPWLGVRCATANTPHPPLREDVPMALLRRVGRYSVFGGYVPHLTIPLQIVVHEFREATPDANKQRAQHVADALAAVLHAPPNVTFVAAGSDSPRQQPVTDAMRLMYSSVDVEIRR